MTPDDKQRIWFTANAEEHGELAAGWMRGASSTFSFPCDTALVAERQARLAGHFGRLANGEYRNALRAAKKAAFLAGFAAARKGTAEDAWEDSTTRFFHDHPRQNGEP